LRRKRHRGTIFAVERLPPDDAQDTSLPDAERAGDGLMFGPQDNN